MTWTPADVPDLGGRRALVTGATSGIGRALAAALAAHGAQVLVAGRDPERLAATLTRLRHDDPGADLVPLRVDLADQASVRRAAALVADQGALHLLVNNAGVMAPPYARTADGFELQTATNVLGPFALTGLLLPSLVEGGRGRHGDARVVMVSSVGHRLARRSPLGDPRVQNGRYHRWRVYAETKLADLMLAFELDGRAREAGLPLRALAAHPGFAGTALMSSRGRILDAAFASLGQPPASGALPLLMAATADLPGSTYVGPGGPGELSGPPQVVGTSERARDPDAGRRLWELAEEATGVRHPWWGAGAGS